MYQGRKCLRYWDFQNPGCAWSEMRTVHYCAHNYCCVLIRKSCFKCFKESILWVHSFPFLLKTPHFWILHHLYSMLGPVYMGWGTPGRWGNPRWWINQPVHSLRSRRLEVAGERENGRARGRHACLLLARPFFLVPTTSKRLLRRLARPYNLSF